MTDNSIQAEQLSKAELDWLDEQRTIAVQMVSTLNGTPACENPPIEALHAAFDLWMASFSKRSILGKLKKKPAITPNMIALAFGVTLGDRIAERTGLEWRIITDSFGTDLGLYTPGVSGKYSDIVTHPMSVVAKRIESHTSGWVMGTTELLIEEVQRGIGDAT